MDKTPLIHELLIRSATIFPDKEAVVHGKHRATYSRLDHLSDSLACFLMSRGVQKGDRVGILFENSIDYIVSFFAVLKSGGVSVALNTQLSSRNIREIIEDCRPVAIVVRNRLLRKIQDITTQSSFIKTIITDGNCEDGSNLFELKTIMESDYKKYIAPKLSSNDLACIIYTSGTTGKPKGVMLSHCNLSENTESIISYLELSSSDSVMVVLPFYYSYGNSLLLTHVAVGGKMVLENSFMYPNVILEKINKESVTGFSGVPSTYAILLHKSNFRNYTFPTLRYITQAGGAMAPALIKQLRKTLPETKIFIMYGQTEASARLSYLDPDHLDKKVGSIGKAIPGIELSVLNKKGKQVKTGEVGEIVARGKNIMPGYWNDPVETKKVLKNERLHTGDLAKVDEEGYLYIVSRKSEMIKSGAHRISPKEIEDVLYEHPAVAECAVVGIADQILGEAIQSCIVLKKGETVAERELLAFCSSNLAPYKIPKSIIFVDSLPKTASGKIKKRELAAQYHQIREEAECTRK